MTRLRAQKQMGLQLDPRKASVNCFLLIFAWQAVDYKLLHSEHHFHHGLGVGRSVPSWCHVAIMTQTWNKIYEKLGRHDIRQTRQPQSSSNIIKF